MVRYLLGVLFVVLGVGLSIGLHEIGHLVPAKRFGVKVTQYMVGFGPTLWSRRRGETEYGIKAIPLGGYIRMIGMFPPRPGDKPGTLRVSSTGRFSQLADEARQLSLEEIRPGDERRVFYRLSVPKKVVVMMGGPLMNLLIAVVLLSGIVTLYGVATPGKGAKVASVSECVVPAKQAAAKTTCAPTDPKTPAYMAGLRPGDLLLSVAGQPVTRTTDVGRLVRPRVGERTTIVVRRDGVDKTLVATPIRNTVQQVGPNGTPLVDQDGQPVVVTAGFLGISSAAPVSYQRQPLSVVPSVVGQGLEQTAGVILHIPQKMTGVVKAAFGSGARDPNGPVSVVGVGRMAGEASAGKVAWIGGPDGINPFVFLLSLIASLNLALFVFNLIPLLPLDGGHVAGALWEGLKRNGARILGRRDPGHVDVAKALPVAYAVSSVLIVMSVLLIYADIVKPISLGG
ncbi:M50 family metallopeptidase [Pedococcus sp. 5OH_020]|uniref:M50 family metallopeptidase n=1 Tax=Pedococcus sp. 5OH_020 TaxID=2989814 RepID=UPI0022E9AE85|nr:site-2 protease family protein [Pedococcus sp. 5OH_020]